METEINRVRACGELWPTIEAKSMAREENDRVEERRVGVVLRAGIVGPQTAMRISAVVYSTKCTKLSQFSN